MRARGEPGHGRSVARRTAAQLPLAADRTGRRPRLDLVVFVVDLTSAMSYAQLRSNILNVEADYLLGRACIVATHGMAGRAVGSSKVFVARLLTHGTYRA